jgi:hypothetical protein
MGGLEISLAAAALLIGATGAFSPCGFSVVETLGPTGHTGGRRTTVAACIAFIPGAVVGGVLTFGALAAAGELVHGAGGKVAYAIAAAIAVLAAVLEVRGTRIVPQIRRQLPEHWRRVMPMPLAGALYGVLLGMGFTTFVLSFGVWALAAISFAVGEPLIGLILGVCFGIGRAIPVVALAPLAGSPAGARATDLMALSPGVYLGMRRGDAAVLAVSALALVLSVGSAGASSPVVSAAADPSVSAADGALVFERVGGAGVLLQAGSEHPLPGSDPAIGGSYIAVRDGETIRLLDRGSLAPIGDPIPAPGTDAIAVSASWLAYRSRSAESDRLLARDISNPAAPGPELQIDVATDPNQVSPPSLDGATLLYAVARVKGSRIVRYALPSGGKDTLLRSNESLLFNPSVFGDSFAYVRTERSRAKLLVRDLDGKGQGHTILKRRRSGGELWSTALSADQVYVTLLDPSSTSASAEVISQSLAGRKGKK